MEHVEPELPDGLVLQVEPELPDGLVLQVEQVGQVEFSKNTDKYVEKDIEKYVEKDIDNYVEKNNLLNPIIEKKILKKLFPKKLSKEFPKELIGILRPCKFPKVDDTGPWRRIHVTTFPSKFIHITEQS